VGGIRLEGVSKVYPGGVRAIDEVDLEIDDGEFVVLVGPSGCGKSTLLRMIAGLEDVTHGVVRVGERDVTALSPRERDIAMVFQNYALYPHMSVEGNLAYGLRLRKRPKQEIAEQVGGVAGTLGLRGLLARRPGALSGGQRQRVAMGRAMVREPQAFLMDEPLSNLDAKLRIGMRAELSRLHDRLGVTTVYVTHDQTEAMTLGNRVAVLRDGVLQQFDPPQRLYDRPANLFVGTFIGSPPMNLVRARIAEGTVRFAEHVLPLPASSPLRGADREVILGIRPHDLGLTGPPDAPRMPVVAEVVERLGPASNVIFRIDAPPVPVDPSGGAADEDEGKLLADERGSSFTAAVPGHEAIREGETLELVVDVERLYFFDPGTGAALDGDAVARSAA